MIKLVVTDVDGTLVEESKNQINPAYFQVIRDLKAKGIQVVMASGRPYSSMEALFRPVLEELWFIADCGVSIKTQGAMESTSLIPKEWVIELWQDISKIPTADAMVCGAEEVYIPMEGSMMCGIVRDDYQMKTTCLNGWEDIPTVPTGKVSFFAPKNVEELGETYLVPKWKDRLHMVISGEWWYDFMMPQVNKATALEKIMEEYGYTPEEILATGDNMNDLEMMTLAGTSLAVSTARPEVKAVSTRVIGSYKEDAVLEEWKKLL